MRAIFRTIVVAALALVLGLVAAPASPARADHGGPHKTTPGGKIPTNEAGTAVEWDKVNLEYQGEYTEYIVQPWQILGTDLSIGGVGYNYDVYKETNSGDTWVIPSMGTQILTALVGGPTGGPATSQPVDAFLPGGISPFVELAGDVVGHGVAGSDNALASLQHQFSSPLDPWSVVLATGQGLVHTITTTRSAYNRPDEVFTTGLLSNSIYVYEGNIPITCTGSSCPDRTSTLVCNDPTCSGTPIIRRRGPGATAGGLIAPPGGTPPPGSTPPPVVTPPPWTPPPPVYVRVDCPAPFVTTTTPQASIGKADPPYPLVVGQDPEQRGVDVSVSVQSFPVVYTWYEKVVYSEYACGPAGPMDVLDCNQSDGSAGTQYLVRQWEECETRSQSYDDPIVSIGASASLNGESRDWILGELQVAYPGAYLHNPDMGLSPRGGWAAAGAGTSSVGALIRQVQLADPGVWNLSISGYTAGTPVSAPLSFGATSDLQVWMLRVTLTD